MSRPAPRRHRAARLLALTSGPTPTAEEPVDVRPKPELFRFCCLRSESEGCVIRTYIFPGFTSPGLDSHSHDPRPRRNQYAPMGTQLSEISVPIDHTASAGLESCPENCPPPCVARSTAAQHPQEHDDRKRDGTEQDDQDDHVKDEHVVGFSHQSELIARLGGCSLFWRVRAPQTAPAPSLR